MRPGHHITLRLAEHEPIAQQITEVRMIARLMYRIGGDSGLLAFRLADHRLHCVAQGLRADVGELARRLEIAIWRTLGLQTPFARAEVREIRTSDDVERAVRFMFRESANHALSFDPCSEACSLLDVLGLRRIDSRAVTARLLDALPGLDPEGLRPLLRVDDRAAPSTADLIDAACAAVAEPHLRSKARPAVEARRALAHLLRGQISGAALARSLGIARLVPHEGVPSPKLITATLRLAELRATRRLQQADLAAAIESTRPRP